MREELLSRLVTDGHFVAGGEIDANVPVMGIGQRNVRASSTCTVVTIYRTKSGNIVLDVVPLDGNSPKVIRVGADAITRIDGMMPERLAEHYELDEFGANLVVTAKRRGRAPKSLVDDIDDDYFDDLD